VIGAVHLQTAEAQAVLPPGFHDSVVLEGLQVPTAVAFAPDGRVFVAEKAGIVKVFASLSDMTPTVFADLRTEVNDYRERGLLGLALDPAFPARPYVYVLYTRDAPLGGTVPTWGQPGTDDDPCPDEFNGCLVSGRLARLEADHNGWTGRMDVLVDGWPTQFDSHSIGALVFGPDGALYASGGDGGGWQFVDYGERGVPVNPAGDPPAGVGGVMTSPSAEGGALRAQDLRTDGDPVGLNGAVIRIDPDTGEGFPGNPLGNHPDPNARRIVAYGFRNPYRIAIRPGTSQVWVGDVGWRLTEEINVIPEPGAGAAVNFGWPCYEGSGPQPNYQATGLTICEQLYADPGVVTFPHFEYVRGGFVWPGDDSCGNANAALSGMAFHEAGSYPAAYRGVLFFADYRRQCIWTMHPGPDGTPSPKDVRTFARVEALPVDVKQGPGGDIFYVDIGGGAIHRIGYTNALPRAVLTISPASGTAPLTVLLDAQKSTDPEGAALTYEWDLDNDGTFDAGAMSRSHVFTVDGTYRVRLRVTDDLGGTDIASGEVVVGGSAPTWAASDIGDVGVVGSTHVENDIFSLQGAGSDVWGTTDAFQYAWRTLHGDGTITAYVSSFDGADPWSKAGVMIRGSLASDAPHAFLFLSAANGTAFQRRHAAGGATTHTGGAPFHWLRLERAGDQVTASISDDGQTWEDVARDTIQLPVDALIGLAVTSHDRTRIATAVFTSVAITAVPAVSTWHAVDVGSTGAPGSVVEQAGRVVVSGSGADVWGGADAFHFAHRLYAGDLDVIVRVTPTSFIDPWAKFGIMVRDSLQPDSPHAFLLLSGSEGVAFQRRHVAGGGTSHSGGGAAYSTEWLRLVRVGNRFTAFRSVDGLSWAPFAEDEIHMGGSVVVGLAVTSHSFGARATASFDHVIVSGAPASWDSADVGPVLAGTTDSAAAGSLTLTGGGADIWGTSDAFRYAYRTLNGDGEIVARLASLAGPHRWSKLGVMIRESLAPESPHGFLLVSSSRGIAFQRRLVLGDSSIGTTQSEGTAPVWVRLVREGIRLSAYRSDDGVSWVYVDSDSIPMSDTVLIGIAITAHTDDALATGEVDSIRITGG
jgi:glucose/arabinose dehydrogenase/PKD repeat protein